MYTGLLKAPEEGVCHLLYYCCLKDGRFIESALDTIAEKLVSIDLHKKLNFKDELSKYKSYKNTVTDEAIYLQYLISIIKPVNTLALFSWCVELCSCDNSTSIEEEALLAKIAKLLTIGEMEKDLVLKLMVERNTVLVEKVF